MKTVLNAMITWPPILLGAFVLFSALFHYPRPEAKYARIAVGIFGACLLYAGIHMLLWKSN
ncbi:MAG: hypothetical protein DMG76_25340 [Acidobacteria bacterium]|nr:MAG: hypothetical protein DMG76_25340 [Acidobacteriota bacterium]